MINKTLKLDLRKQRSFFNTAELISHQDYSVYWKKSEQPGFQVVIAKRTVTTAVERNAIKRRVFEVIESLLPDYLIRNLAVVIVVRRKHILENLPAVRESLLALGA